MADVHVGPVRAPLIPTLILVTGGYLMWFAVHYWRDVKAVYPSDPVKSILTGKGMPSPAREGSPQDPSTSDSLSFSQIIQGQEFGGGTTAVQGGGTAPAGNFTQADMVTYWTSQGGDSAHAEFAAGVMMAESSGNPNATSSNPDGGTNVGLFQLDTKGVGAGRTVAELKDPALNTQITILATRNGTDWADWADPFVDVHGHSGNL